MCSKQKEIPTEMTECAKNENEVEKSDNKVSNFLSDCKQRVPLAGLIIMFLYRERCLEFLTPLVMFGFPTYFSMNAVYDRT